MSRSLSKKTRFEVFKRDSFTCQYCGVSAPDAVLQADHIQSVKDGGANDLLNLVTSCSACNSGKGARSLDDSTAVKKRMNQLKLLNAKREQLEMVAEWQRELSALKDRAVEVVAERYEKLAPGWELSRGGRNIARKCLREFSLAEVLDAMEIAVEKYGDRAMRMLGGICRNTRIAKTKPHWPRVCYVVGILRNRCSYVPAWASRVIDEAHASGVPVEAAQELAKEAHSWSSFEADLAAMKVAYGA